MRQVMLKIDDIPTVIWGESSQKLIIAVHGAMSNKTDMPIKILSETACTRGYQVLSFDLPEHGDRKNSPVLCKVQQCIKELSVIMEYAEKKWNHISLFANSLGAYFSLLSYANEPLERAWFLSPAVDMRRIIENMMSWFQITEEQLKSQQTIPTPAGQTLYWDYYCYVKEHPIVKWNAPTCILYGSQDDMCEKDTILKFVQQFQCNLEIADDAEHYFYTPAQLEQLRSWLEKTM